MHFDFRFSLFLYECYLDISGFSGWNMIWLSSFFLIFYHVCIYVCYLFVGFFGLKPNSPLKVILHLLGHNSIELSLLICLSSVVSPMILHSMCHEWFFFSFFGSTYPKISFSEWWVCCWPIILLLKFFGCYIWILWNVTLPNLVICYI